MLDFILDLLGAALLVGQATAFLLFTGNGFADIAPRQTRRGGERDAASGAIAPDVQ